MNDKSLKLACRKMGNGRNISGRLIVSDRKLYARLFNYDDFFHVDTEEHIFLELENCNIATLFDCVPSGPGQRTSHGKRVWFERIISNGVLIGPDPWDASTLVRSATFGFIGADTALFTTDVIDSEFEYPGKVGKECTETRDIITVNYDKSSIIKVKSDNIDIDVNQTVSRSIGSQQQSVTVTPYISVDFIHGARLHEYLEIICDIVGLFGLSIGQASRPFDIRISASSQADKLFEIEQETYRGDFSARYVWPKHRKDKDRVWAGGAVLQVINERERAATSACLKAWIERRKEWRGAYALMMGVLKRRNRMDRDRLMNAFAWFEEIPLKHKPTSKLMESFDKLVSSTVAKAAELGLGSGDIEYPNRIRSCLHNILNESPNARFKRLITTIRDKFGERLVPSTLEADCKMALSFRNKAAHGFIDYDDDSYYDFCRGLYAVETVSFLLMIRDLPLSDAVAERLCNHPLMEYLHMMPRPQGKS